MTPTSFLTTASTGESKTTAAKAEAKTPPSSSASPPVNTDAPSAAGKDATAVATAAVTAVVKPSLLFGTPKETMATTKSGSSFVSKKAKVGPQGLSPRSTEATAGAPAPAPTSSSGFSFGSPPTAAAVQPKPAGGCSFRSPKQGTAVKAEASAPLSVGSPKESAAAGVETSGVSFVSRKAESKAALSVFGTATVTMKPVPVVDDANTTAKEKIPSVDGGDAAAATNLVGEPKNLFGVGAKAGAVPPPIATSGLFSFNSSKGSSTGTESELSFTSPKAKAKLPTPSFGSLKATAGAPVPALAASSGSFGCPKPGTAPKAKATAKLSFGSPKASVATATGAETSGFSFGSPKATSTVAERPAVVLVAAKPSPSSSSSPNKRAATANFGTPANVALGPANPPMSSENPSVFGAPAKVAPKPSGSTFSSGACPPMSSAPLPVVGALVKAAAKPSASSSGDGAYKSMSSAAPSSCEAAAAVPLPPLSPAEARFSQDAPVSPSVAGGRERTKRGKDGGNEWQQDIRGGDDDGNGEESHVPEIPETRTRQRSQSVGAWERNGVVVLGAYVLCNIVAATLYQVEASECYQNACYTESVEWACDILVLRC